MPVDIKRVSRDTLYMALFTTVTITVWIGIEIFRSLTRSEVPRVEQQQLEPMPKGLNQEALQLIRQKVSIGEDQVRALPVGSPAVTESGKSVSIEVTPSPVATAGGGI